MTYWLLTLDIHCLQYCLHLMKSLVSHEPLKRTWQPWMNSSYLWILSVNSCSSYVQLSIMQHSSPTHFLCNYVILSHMILCSSVRIFIVRWILFLSEFCSKMVSTFNSIRNTHTYPVTIKMTCSVSIQCNHTLLIKEHLFCVSTYTVNLATSASFTPTEI